jgi:hypothetical protein
MQAVTWAANLTWLVLVEARFILLFMVRQIYSSASW